MVPAYSPHREGGGTLHFFPSPTHLHNVDASSALAQLRRSLSRSPSKGPTFRLIPATRSAVPSPSSPLSPSASSSNLRDCHTAPAGSPLAVPFSPSAKKVRSSARRPSPMRASHPHLLLSAPRNRSPAKRVLGESSDNGNATPPSSLESSSGEENDGADLAEHEVARFDGYFGPHSRKLAPSIDCAASDNNLLNPNQVFARKERQAVHFADATGKSSPLKRSDGSMNLDLSQLDSPSAKRRSLHGASFGPDFNIFDAVAAAEQSAADITMSSETAAGNVDPATGTPYSPMPKRSSSLRKTTLQQRHEKPLFKTKPNHEPPTEFGSPIQMRSKPRLSMDSIPQPARDSPFSSQGSLPSASVHPMPSYRTNQASSTTAQVHPQRHPLSRTLTQSSSNSSLAEDSPTHAPIRQTEFRRPSIDFTKSLPLQAAKSASSKGPTVIESSSQASSFATPESYKLAKPLPAAFMSTGLISKRNHHLDDAQLDLRESVGHMPDTPCKRPLSMTTVSPFVKPEPIVTKARPNRHTLHSFGTPSTPFNPHASRPSLEMARGTSIFGSSFANSKVSRRGSFLSTDGDEILAAAVDKIDSQSSAEFDIPPTPTKQVIGHDFSNANRSRLGSEPSPAPLLKASIEMTSHDDVSQTDLDLNSKHGTIGKSPKTPSESMVPPDPSRLSISVPSDQHAIFPNHNTSGRASLFPPATPTANRDGFTRFGKHKASVTPVHHIQPVEVDPSIISRFDRAELVGLGEFSQVFMVTKNSGHNQDQSTVLGKHLARGSRPLKSVWAVKKSRRPYIGPRDRRLKLKEVEILRALSPTDHTIQFFDSWEHQDHLFIQTEYCEEGSLDVFLAQAGNSARLDDFRIWKILLEVSLGLKHIHDRGIIHLDLKPANILITFEGVLKIGDFGLATFLPAEPDIEGEGDREYIGPEILMGKYDKPADVFSLGMMMLEIAANVMLPDNGVSWQRLRRGDMSDVPSLTWSDPGSLVVRDSSGKPISRESSWNESHDSGLGADLESKSSFNIKINEDGRITTKQPPAQRSRAGELRDPPAFMVEPSNDQALDNLVRWMISPEPADRPSASDLLAAAGVRWVQSRRRAGATIYEGHWGPADEILQDELVQDDAEMVDV